MTSPSPVLRSPRPFEPAHRPWGGRFALSLFLISLFAPMVLDFWEKRHFRMRGTGGYTVWPEQGQGSECVSSVGRTASRVESRGRREDAGSFEQPLEARSMTSARSLARFCLEHKPSTNEHRQRDPCHAHKHRLASNGLADERARPRRRGRSGRGSTRCTRGGSGRSDGSGADGCSVLARTTSQEERPSVSRRPRTSQRRPARARGRDGQGRKEGTHEVALAPADPPEAVATE